MSDLKNKCMEKAMELHDGVPYGRDETMLDQVIAVAALVEERTTLKGEDRDNAVAAALLHKCFEAKRVNGGKAMTPAEVAAFTNPQVLSIVQELMTEPEDKSKTKVEQWQEKAEWAQTLSHAAREILMAEKAANFDTDARWAGAIVRSRVAAENGKGDDPYQPKAGSKDTVAWHKEYLATRMIMVDALKDTNSDLYMAVLSRRGAATIKLNALEAQSKEIARLGYRKFNAMVNGGR